ncbi:hypothetical protein OOT46_01575 [Aquabacterium sp. A7-Y]|uniref:hypothetical protein n=1 Tax=Aquabacterium sp. A7-Y TaxID=1349605 RepID=UPI00223D14EC|nr:hypothetical protein [Aquabacterium sp. A7-Y]MCW7536546.1 hypothetical protein [Aquabacterium sp. A7-Y]
MQITPLASGANTPRVAASDEAAPAAPRSAGQAAVAARETPAPARAPRAGLRSWDPRFNQQLAGAQRALDFLNETVRQLEQLKTQLAGRLAAVSAEAGGAQAGSLERSLQRFAAHWRRRAEAGGGTLDSRLAHVAQGSARQRFTVRGLELASLRSGGAETLAFSVGAAGQKAVRVHLEPGLSDDELVQRLDQALAPAGIRAERDARGELVFSTPESEWARVRDGLAVHGGGIRFPGGAFHAARIEAEPEAVRPESWAVEQRAKLRETLQEVLDALDRVRRARESVQQALARSGERFDAGAALQEAGRAQGQAVEFERAAAQPGYDLLQSIAPALSGLGRHRVLALLGLGGG